MSQSEKWVVSSNADRKDVCDSARENPWVWWLLGSGFCALGCLATYARRRKRRIDSERLTPRDLARIAALAREWAALDPDPDTRDVVLSWASSIRESGARHSEDSRSVSASFFLARLAPEDRLSFGTAGLRAEMGPGYDRMNAYTVMTATQGVVKVMQREQGVKLSEKGVAIGYDGRRNSQKFAGVAAAVFAAQNVKVRLFNRSVPTPLVAYSVLHYGLAGSIVITASHNPPNDNGYKLYWDNGSQILSPRDSDIESAIRDNPRAWTDYNFDLAYLRSLPLVTDPTDECLDAYISEATEKLHWVSDQDNSTTRRLVYTACHGVGYSYLSRLFSSFKLPEVIPVEEQTLFPDPNFPTLPKPNPEEHNALSLAISKARESGAQLVLANDPDADRLGAAELDLQSGDVKIFSGDEIALLLADFMLLRHKHDKNSVAVVASTVSSKILLSAARVEGFQFREAKTGFKWLSHEASRLRAQGRNVILAYEEAIGFMVGDVVLDKDGLTAAAVFAEMAGYWSARGKTLRDHLPELYKQYGYHLSCNGYLEVTESSTRLNVIFDNARSDGFPDRVGQCDVVSVRDLTLGTDTSQPDGRSVLSADPKTQFVTLTCQSPLASESSAAHADTVISLRGSGTEPKVKYYAELRCDEMHATNGLGQTHLRNAVRDAIEKILKPSENKLKLNF